ncbi:MAG: hypothetical protein ABEJ57_06860 [Halobacteriaceae archaeon]
MGWYRRYARVVFGPNRRNLATVAAVGALLFGAYVVLPAVSVAPSTLAGLRYLVGLAVFSIWMAWFVAAGVAVWRAGEFGEHR